MKKLKLADKVTMLTVIASILVVAIIAAVAYKDTPTGKRSGEKAKIIASLHEEIACDFQVVHWKWPTADNPCTYVKVKVVSPLGPGFRQWEIFPVGYSGYGYPLAQPKAVCMDQVLALSSWDE